MRLIEILRKPSTLHLLFATIFLIPFQTALLYPFSIESLNILKEQPESLFHFNPILLVGFILLPIIYCIIISLLFSPKRLVNPIHIQIGAFLLFSIHVINVLLGQSITQEKIENLTGNLFFIAMYIMLIGFSQFIIVWWVVGLTYEDSYRKSFVINCSPKKVVEILGKNFKIAWRFKPKIEGKDDPIWTLKYQDTARNFVIVSFGSDKNDKNKCVLATVAFHKDLSWIFKSQIATEICNSIINDIKGRLQKANPKLVFSPLEKVDDFISVKTFSYIETITKSKIDTFVRFFFRITPFFRIAIVLTIIAMVIASFSCHFNFITIDAYSNILIAIVIALILEVGVPLREEISLKKVDEFN